MLMGMQDLDQAGAIQRPRRRLRRQRINGRQNRSSSISQLSLCLPLRLPRRVDFSEL
jgi:hypothetical protein